MQKSLLPAQYYAELAAYDLGWIDPAAAVLLRFERGGHLLIAVEQPRVRAEVQAFIRAHAGPGG